MTRSIPRRAAAAAVTVLALVSLAACGGDDDSNPTASESSDSSTAETGDEPDASTSTEDGNADDDSEKSDDPDDADGGADVGDEVEASEFIDLYLKAMDEATTATLELSFAGSAAVEGTGSADFTTTPPSMELVIADGGTGQDQRLVIVDGKAYLALAAKQYVEYDLSDPNSPLGDLTDQLDPRAMGEVFEEGITRSAYVGEEKVEGEAMEHYTVSVDPTALLDEAELPPGAPTPEVEDEVVFDIWFDEDGMVRRQEASLGGTAGSVKLDYDNWGAPVDIEAPPESQVTRLQG